MLCVVKNCGKPQVAKRRCEYHAKRTKVGTHKAARSYIDYDYLDRLSPKDREWLDQFTKEYYLANLGVVKEMKPLHRKKAHKLSNYAGDNTRRRNVELTLCQPLGDTLSIHSPSPEDAMIELVDRRASQARRAKRTTH